MWLSKIIKPLLRVEVPRLIIITLATAGLIALLFGFDQLSKPDLDIQLHDTYFVLSTIGLGVHLFLWLAYLYYLLIQLIGKFRLNTSTVIMISTNALLLTFYAHLYIQLGHIGWEIDPDYKTVSATTLLDSKGLWVGIRNFMIFAQFFLSLTFIYILFRSIKAYKSK